MISKEESKGPGRKKLRLGEYLLNKGLITKQELQEALEEQKVSGQTLGQILINKNFVEERQVYRVLAEQFGIEFLDLFGINISSDLVSLLPEHTVKTYCIMPVKKENNILTIAMSNPTDTFAIDKLRSLTGLIIKPVMSSKTQIMAAIEKYYGGGIIEEALSIVKGREIKKVEPDREVMDEVAKIKQSAEEAPIVKLVNAIILDSVNSRASDIHIEPLEKDCRVRFRIDGVLHEITTISKRYYGPVISRIKIMANMDIAERRIPQDGSFRTEIDEKHIDIRVSTYPTLYGEKLVMRLLIVENVFFPLNELGFEQEELNAFESLIRRPCGIFLVVGPTGSGKTTTLYSVLTHINSREKNIITIEDPIEYEIKGISQSQVNPKAGFTFANSLRSMMRQDPDIILIGEIRDLETAELAVRAALTGHLVFSTLHTNDACGAVTRLIDMGIEPYLISSSLIGVLAQRLVRVICPHCREQISPPSSILRDYKEELELFKDKKKNFYHGKGCEYCRNTGFLGREGVFELLQISGEEMKESISSGFRTSALRKIAREQKFRSIKENGFLKVLRGTTTLEEVLLIAELV
jgi:type IV pilus assembly protein PilB